MTHQPIKPAVEASTPVRTFPSSISKKERLVWRVIQGLFFVIGLTIFLLLLFAPSLGLHAFWNVLIPVAPALVVFAPGLWRNVCPLASAALLPRHMNWSLRKKLPDRWKHRLNLFAILLLLAIVPSRHLLLDTSGPATAAVIASLAVLAVGLGFVFEWKSAWCSGLCPVHPVEKLYGTKPAIAFKNAHCHQCEQCVSICPDSVSGRHLVSSNSRIPQRIGEYLMVGGFPGFIWGWSQVPDYAGGEGWSHVGEAYALPLAGLALTMVLYAILKALCGDRKKTKRLLVDVFAAGAVSCYYWFRLPALFGYAPNPGDGMLVDLREVLSESSKILVRVATTSLFFWWLVASKRGLAKWSIRPQFSSFLTGETVETLDCQKESSSEMVEDLVGKVAFHAVREDSDDGGIRLEGLGKGERGSEVESGGGVWGGFDHEIAGCELPAAECLFKDVAGDTVFGGAGGVEELQFAPNRVAVPRELHPGERSGVNLPNVLVGEDHKGLVGVDDGMPSQKSPNCGGA